MSAALILFAVSVVTCAAALTTILWRRLATSAPGPWERVASIAVSAFAIAIAINWSLSWLDMLDRGPLLVCGTAILIPSTIFLGRQGLLDAAQHKIQGASLIVFLVPLIIWVVFALWRGSIVPVLSHDALAYHMPKAVMLARAHHYEFFDAPDPRISTSPANYEMLVADMMLLTGSDELTEWICTATYVPCFFSAPLSWNDGGGTARRSSPPFCWSPPCR